MVFAYAIDDGSLTAFSTEGEAIAYAEGIDVEDGAWRFFADDGAELTPCFKAANERSAWFVRSGNYNLVRGERSNFNLRDLMPEVRSYEGIVRSLAEVLRVLNGNRIE